MPPSSIRVRRTSPSGLASARIWIWTATLGNDIQLKNFNFAGGPYQGATVNWSFPGKIVGFNNGLAYVSALSAGAMIDGIDGRPRLLRFNGLRRRQSERTVQQRYRRLRWT